MQRFSSKCSKKNAGTFFFVENVTSGAYLQHAAVLYFAAKELCNICAAKSNQFDIATIHLQHF